MAAPNVIRPGKAAPPPRETSLLRWVWRAYLRNALVPLLVVALLLVADSIGGLALALPAGSQVVPPVGPEGGLHLVARERRLGVAQAPAAMEERVVGTARCGPGAGVALDLLQGRQLVALRLP